jgi:hypothetical protein
LNNPIFNLIILESPHRCGFFIGANMPIKGVIPQISNPADVWISEEHRRELEITENPIEYGAPTTDHAFLLPQELIVEFGVTNSPLQANDVFGVYGVNRIENARKYCFSCRNRTF